MSAVDLFFGKRICSENPKSSFTKKWSSGCWFQWRIWTFNLQLIKNRGLGGGPWCLSKKKSSKRDFSTLSSHGDLKSYETFKQNFISRWKFTPFVPDKIYNRVPSGLLAVTCFDVGNFVFDITDQDNSPFISTSGFWEQAGREVTESLKAFSEIKLIDIEKRVNGVNQTGWWIKISGKKNHSDLHVS